ncbi:MAG: hypothetical protein IJ111_03905 [Eggerthellaceae bacterium]|nr:hypothetical protein [Eggerthellaceae bacterium]
MGDNANKPEPPVRWNPEDSEAPEQPESLNEAPSSNRRVSSQAATAVIGKTKFSLNAEEFKVFQSARKYITASQVIAVFSLFFGGVFLSAVAIGFGCVAYGKLNQLAENRYGNPELQRTIRRSGMLVIAVAAFALVLNIVALVFLYPMVAETLQGTDLGALTGISPSIGSSGSSTWG